MEEYAKEYSIALYDLVAEDGAEEVVLQQFKVVAQAFSDNPAYVGMLNTPGLPKAERVQMIDEIFGQKVHPYLLNVLKILAEKRAVGLVPRCYEAYEALYYQRHNILTVTAITAVPMKDSAKEQLIEKLSKKTGKTIFLKNVVDPTCIGGIKIIYDGKLTDASVKNWMEQLQAGLMKLECK